MPKDKEGYSFFRSINKRYRVFSRKNSKLYNVEQATDGTTLRRYTKLRMEDWRQPSVRLLHNGRLSNDDRGTIRDSISSARHRVNKSVEFLGNIVDTREISPETSALLNKHFRINATDKETELELVSQIHKNMKEIADLLYSPKLEIKLNDSLSLDDDGLLVKDAPHAPYRSLSRYVRTQFGRDGGTSGPNLRMTKSAILDPRSNTDQIIAAAAAAASVANLHDNERERTAADIRNTVNWYEKAFFNSAGAYADFTKDVWDSGEVRNRPIVHSAPSTTSVITDVAEENPLSNFAELKKGVDEGRISLEDSQAMLDAMADPIPSSRGSDEKNHTITTLKAELLGMSTPRPVSRDPSAPPVLRTRTGDFGR